MKQAFRFLLGVLCVLLIAAVPALAADTPPDAGVQIDFAPNTRAPGILSATITGVPDDVSAVTCTVWCRLSDMDSYGASRQEDGSWRLSIANANHGFRPGQYTLVAWTMGEDGSRKLLGTQRTELKYTVGELTAQPLDEEASSVVVRLASADLPANCPVFFRVFLELTPQDVRSYFAYPQEDGSYVGTVLPARHGMAGRYQVDACAGSTSIASTGFEVAGCSRSHAVTDEVAGTPGGFRIRAYADAPAGVQGLRAAVWTEEDKSDLLWHDMEHTGGIWSVVTSPAEHDWRFGTYNIEVYAELGNGLLAKASEVQHECVPRRYTSVEQVQQGSYEIKMLGTGLAPGTMVKMPAWSAENGQDDIYWYSAEVDAEGNVRCALDLSVHSSSSPLFKAQFIANDELLAEIEYEVDGAVPRTPAQLELNSHCRDVYEEVGRDLHSVYMWTVENIKYEPRPWRENPPKGFTREQGFAREAFTTRKGDCFVFSAAFAELARGLGYDAQYVEGYVWSVRGVWADHGFVVIHKDGIDYVCDPELQSVAKKPKDLFMQEPGRTLAKYKW